jgi:hypothetical protein
LKEVMLILPPVQFGNSRYRLLSTLGCGRRYCSRTQSGGLEGKTALEIDPLLPFLAFPTTNWLKGLAPFNFGNYPILAILAISSTPPPSLN